MTTFTEALMLLVGGLLGSAHCIGMCGGFVLTLGTGQTGWRNRVGRQLVYALGRVSVYVVAGAMAAFAGWKLGLATRTLVNLQAILCLAAGALLVLEAAWSLGWLPRSRGPAGICPMVSVGALLRSPNWFAVFAAGVWNGFMPCGLVYGYLALAAATNDMLLGAAVMLLFGTGTVPALVVTGVAGSMIAASWRRRVFQIAAGCLLATGLLTIGRGISFFNRDEQSASDVCPFCARP